MSSCLAPVRSFVAEKVTGVRLLLAIPPRSESMAGVIILFVFTNSVATSVWMFNAWTPFIYLLFGQSNKYVGLMAAVNGVFELATAFVSGHLADRVLGPSRTLRYAIIFGFFTLTMVLIGIWTEKTWLLVFAQMCEGTYMGFSFTCLESVFAQCMRKGERDRLYSIKFAFEASGPIVGLVSIITLFLILGDEWEKPVLRKVMTVGLLLHLSSMVTFLCTFVPLPSHLDRQRRQQQEQQREQQPQELEQEEGQPRFQGKVSDVVVVDGAAQGTLEPYEHEDERLPEEGDDEPLQLHLSREVEMINLARTALLQARSLQPPRTSSYEPSVCTAAQPSPADYEDAASQLVNTQSFFSAGGIASTRFGAQDGDDSASKRGSEVSREDSAREVREQKREGGAKESPATTAAAAAAAGEGEEEGRRIVGYVDMEYDSATGLRRRIMDCIPLKKYPLFVVLSDMIMTIGSGMTTQYFSLFMMSIYGISPVVLNSLMLLNAFIISTMAIVNGRFGQKYGRVRALLPTKFIGAFILLYMALARDRPEADGGHHEIHMAKRVIMCVCFCVRNAFMNCSAGLSRALIMDLVSEKNRGRWNALESVQSAGWSGTALVGGFLADKWGYGAAFIFTFFFHLESCVMLLPLTVRNDSKLPIPVYEGAAAANAAPGDACADLVGSTPDGGSAVLHGLPVPHHKPPAAAPDTAAVAELTVANVQRIVSAATLGHSHSHQQLLQEVRHCASADSRSSDAVKEEEDEKDNSSGARADAHSVQRK